MSFFAVTSSRPPAEESSKLPEVGIELRSEQKLEGLCDQLSTTTHRFETWARVREQSLHIDDSSQLLAVAKALFAEKWPNLLSQLEELPLDHLTRVCLDISSRMLHGDISKARFLDPGEPSIWEEVEYKIAICVIQPLLARLSERDVLALYAPMMEEYFLHILKFGDISRLEQIATFCRREFIESPETSGVAKERILSEFEQLGVNGKSLVQKLPVCANFATGKWDLRSDPELAAAAILTVERLLEWGICAPTFMYGVAELFGYQSYFESDSFYSAAATGIAEALEFHRATHAIKIHALVSSLMRESLSADEFTQKSQEFRLAIRPHVECYLKDILSAGLSEVGTSPRLVHGFTNSFCKPDFFFEPETQQAIRNGVERLIASEARSTYIIRLLHFLPPRERQLELMKPEIQMHFARMLDTSQTAEDGFSHLEKVAEGAFKAGDKKQLKRCSRQMLRMIDENPALIDIDRRLGRIFFLAAASANSTESSLRLHEVALAHRITYLKPDSPDIAESLEHVSRYFELSGDFKIAEPIREVASAIRRVPSDFEVAEEIRIQLNDSLASQYQRAIETGLGQLVPLPALERAIGLLKAGEFAKSQAK